MREIKIKFYLKGKKGINMTYIASVEQLSKGKFDELLKSGMGIIGRSEFIGLKDKNEKEIYEGDIIRGAGEMGYVIFLVEWNIRCMKFEILPIKKSFDKDLFKYCRSYEVIGNIYENKELLEEIN